LAMSILDVSQLSAPIPAGGQAEFTIKMNLDYAGTYNSVFELRDLVNGHRPAYSFNVSGQVNPLPALSALTALKQVLVNATNPLISDGGMASLGTHDQNTSQDHMQVFRVLNSSTEALQLSLVKTAGSLAMSILDVSQLSAPIPAGGQAEFTIKMNLDYVGTYNSVFELRDLVNGHRPAYSFNVSGQVQAPNHNAGVSDQFSDSFVNTE
ncbi:hypothetical protein, partial [Leptobacterium sp. I13]|uniref:hypothetical protein n=1 Tax=Leptobacterium meishanense TaxID=3128904 RepID=UPI0030EE367B